MDLLLGQDGEDRLGLADVERELETVGRRLLRVRERPPQDQGQGPDPGRNDQAHMRSSFTGAVPSLR